MKIALAIIAAVVVISAFADARRLNEKPKYWEEQYQDDGEDCVDTYRHCEQFKALTCNADLDTVLSRCPKTCGFCGEECRDDLALAHDCKRLSTDENNQVVCSYEMSFKCRRSCGLCKGILSGKVVKVDESNEDACEDVAATSVCSMIKRTDRCTNGVGKRKCAKTCNYCSNESE
uniref:Toxin candidate TRINITY_DN17602_c0_g1_i1 n=1 Tax=Pachycerianthus borealis TaxID=2736680 RepID=A0A7G7WZ27_9CNID|nr:toxin candidate TRINITY_DN17602_c0_g1_i1 [Pachycerianthus borealis]